MPDIGQKLGEIIGQLHGIESSLRENSEDTKENRHALSNLRQEFFVFSAQMLNRIDSAERRMSKIEPIYDEVKLTWAKWKGVLLVMGTLATAGGVVISFAQTWIIAFVKQLFGSV